MDAEALKRWRMQSRAHDAAFAEAVRVWRQLGVGGEHLSTCMARRSGRAGLLASPRVAHFWSAAVRSRHRLQQLPSSSRHSIFGRHWRSCGPTIVRPPASSGW
ncbi:hypothetical protein [Rhodopseudomonas sp. P2A-2r]|uniref:hypothetical protein n=1 Tax=Rhodopseudomonas sp. P2A-2r TaxID=2991972 RepID=UPI0039B6EF32